MRYRFDDFEFRPDTFELFEGGESKKLQRQPARLLALLLEARGEVLSRDHIQSQLWGRDTFVEVDSSINFAVRQLRLALGDRADSPRYVETLPRLGYRFVAEVEGPEQLSRQSTSESVPDFGHGRVRPAGRAWRLVLGVAAGMTLLALGFGLGSWRDRARRELPPMLRVAPLLSTAPSTDSDALGAGLREQLVSSLVRSYKGQVNVYSGSDAAGGRLPRHGFLLTGTVDRPSDSLARVDLRLSSSDGRSLWTESYQGSVAGLRDWSGSIPLEIAAAFPSDVGRLSRARHLATHVDDAAYGRFLRGVYRTQTIFGSRDPELYRLGVEDLESVVATFPDFVDGQMALARAYLGGVHLFPSAFERARRLASGVLEVEPDHPEALVARGEVALLSRWDIAGAQRDIRLAERLNPGLARARHLIASVLAAKGLQQEAVAAILEARRLDPENLFVSSDVGFFLMLARQPEPALEAARLVAELEPRSRLTHVVILWSMVELGDLAGALGEANRYLAAHGVEPAPSLEAFFAAERQFLVALRDAGGAPVLDLAESAIRAGEPDEALDVLLSGCEKKADPALLFAASDPRLDALRPAPRFSALLECVAGRTSVG